MDEYLQSHNVGIGDHFTLRAFAKWVDDVPSPVEAQPPASNLVAQMREAAAEQEKHYSLLEDGADWIDRASALLPLIPRSVGAELANAVSDLLSQQPLQPKHGSNQNLIEILRTRYGAMDVRTKEAANVIERQDAEIARLRPMAESWESYEAAQKRKGSREETEVVHSSLLGLTREQQTRLIEHLWEASDGCERCAVRFRNLRVFETEGVKDENIRIKERVTKLEAELRDTPAGLAACNQVLQAERRAHETPAQTDSNSIWVWLDQHYGLRAATVKPASPYANAVEYVPVLASVDPPHEHEWSAARTRHECLKGCGSTMDSHCNVYPPNKPPDHADPVKRCQHDLCKPGTTIIIDGPYNAKCMRCLQKWIFPPVGARDTMDKT